MPHRLLCVTGHPDDESGGFGGALMLAAAAGVETSVLCFTDGHAPTFAGKLLMAKTWARCGVPKWPRLALFSV